MSFIPFTTAASSTAFINQPSGIGEKLILVSSDTGDTIAFSLTGPVSGTPTAESLTLSTNSRIERETTNAFTPTLTALTPASSLTGYVSLYGQGTAASGSVTIDTVPTEGQTLALGLVGYQQTYTYRNPARGTIQCPTAANLNSSGTASYIDIVFGGATKRFWFDVTDAGTESAPADPGGGLYTVSVLVADTADTVATALRTSMVTNLTAFVTSVATDTVTITGITLGAFTMSQSDTGNSFTLTSVQAGLAGAANQIRTGYDTDGTAATASDVALWTQYAINATGGTAGTHYGTGTAANAYLSALASSAVVAITDRIACSRSLGWANTSPASITTVNPVGGANGTLLASITASQSIAASQNFDNADLADPTLLALFASTTDWILVNGRPSTLRLKINNVGTAVQVKLQASDDGLDATAYDISGTTALTGTVSGTAAAYTITGSGTVFLTELRVGDVIVIATYAYPVVSIASDTSLAVGEPLVTSPAGAAATKQLPVQIARLDNNSQIIPVPPMEYVRLSFTANANTTDSNLHAGIIV